MAANELFDTGIKVTGSFSAAGAFPADAKSVVNTIAERDDHVTQNRAYDGMEVYVKEVEKKYRYINGEWIDTNYYHPSYVNQASGLYKLEIENGHIKSAIEVTKQDIINLGFTTSTLKAQYNKTEWKDIDNAVLSNIPVILEAYGIDGSEEVIRATLSKYNNTSYTFTAVDMNKIHKFTCDYMSGWSYQTKSFVQSSTTGSFLADAEGNIVVDNNGVTVVSETN